MISEYDEPEHQEPHKEEFPLFSVSETQTNETKIFPDQPHYVTKQDHEEDEFKDLKNIKPKQETPEISSNETIPEVAEKTVQSDFERYSNVIITSTQGGEVFIIESVYRGKAYTVTRSYSNFQWIQKMLKEDVPSTILPSLALQSMIEEHRNSGVRDFPAKMMLKFVIAANSLKCVTSENFIAFMILNQGDFNKRVNEGVQGRGLLFNMRMMGRSVPEDPEFNTKDLVGQYQKLRPGLVHVIRAVKEFKVAQWKYLTELEEVAKMLKIAATMDKFMEKEYTELSDKLAFTSTENKRLFREDKWLPLVDELALVTLELDQVLLFIESKGTRQIECQILKEDFETISRKQDKLRLDEKTKSKGDLMENDVNNAENAYKKAKEIMEEVCASLPNELERFQKERAKNMALSIEHFISQQSNALKKVQLIQ